MRDELAERRQRPVSVMELAVAAVIIGLLGIMAVPMYGKYVARAHIEEATDRVADIVADARAWASAVADSTGVAFWPAPENLDLEPTRRFTYAVSSGGGAAVGTTPFVVTATGRPGTRVAGTRVAGTMTDLSSTPIPVIHRPE